MPDSQHPLPVSRDQAVRACLDASTLWQVIRHLRVCQTAYGLKARHIEVLSAMVGFLKNQRHTMVFASNLALQERLNHISERTLQRAIKDLVEVGMIARHDSPNRKRFALRRRDSTEAIAFGFDLSPLLERSGEISYLAGELERDERHRQILRMKLRAVAAQIEALDPDSARVREIRLIIRRKLGSHELEQVLDRCLEEAGLATNAPCPTIELAPCSNPISAPDMSAADSQIDGHLQMSEKDNLDKNARESRTSVIKDGLNCLGAKVVCDNTLLSEVRAACPEVSAISVTPNPTWRELVDQAPCVARWLGIDAPIIKCLVDRHGPDKAAVTIFCLLQRQDRIKHPGAYLRSLISGKHAAQFDPLRWLRQLSTAVKNMPAHQIT